MSGLKGMCPKCGARYSGWALMNSLKEKCAVCGSDLEIAENGVHIRSHYSSFTTRTFKSMHSSFREQKERS